MAVGGEADRSTPMSIVKHTGPLELSHPLNMARMWYVRFFSRFSEADGYLRWLLRVPIPFMRSAEAVFRISPAETPSRSAMHNLPVAPSCRSPSILIFKN